MPGLWANLLTGVVIAIVSAVVSAIVTVFLAFRRFRRERWWERKADAYSSAIKAFHDLECAISEGMVSLCSSRMGEEQQGERAKHCERALAEVTWVLQASSFIMCPEAHDLLKGFVDTFCKSTGGLGRGLLTRDTTKIVGAMRNQCQAIEECLKVLEPIARKDLGVA